MSIYITGDCHGDYRRFSAKRFPEQKEMTKDDCVIICGDFGFWSYDKEQLWWRKWLEEKPFTTLWVDGNHENFDLLASCRRSVARREGAAHCAIHYPPDARPRSMTSAGAAFSPSAGRRAMISRAESLSRTPRISRKRKGG